MNEVEAIERTCDVCGVEVRDGSLFCYNCGSSVNQAASRVLDGERSADQKPDTSISEVIANESASNLAEIKETSTVRPKRPRRKTSQPREVVWEQPAGLGFGFMITAIILILLTVGVLALGLYLR